jgi:hypothetical protein
MKARRLDDRGEFCASIDRVAPQVLAAWNEIAGTAPDRAAIGAFLSRWNLDVPGLEWLADGLYQSVWSTTGEPWPDRLPDFSLPIPADGVLEHFLPPLVLSWQPGETGEDAATFKKHAHEAIERYVDRVETWRREHKVELPRRQVNRGEAPDGPHRWDLLVSYLVLGRTFDQIGEEIGISRKGATDHIRVLASRLGISLNVRQPKKRG